MKVFFKTYPNISRFTLAILLFGSALVISSLIDTPFLKQYFPFTSAILLLTVTWLLYWLDKKTLKEIGLNLNFKNIVFLPLGLLIGMAVFFVVKYLRIVYLGESFAVSQFINYKTMLYAFYTILPTVAVEEFLFRGYLFKKTIEVSNVVIANIIFSLLFMLIHVLDENVIENKGMLLFLLISIPVGHLLFATALLKSKTLFFPIGLHLGNNWATRHLITSNDTDDSVLYIINTTRFDTWPSFIGFILMFNGVYLLVTLLIWKWDNMPFTKKN